MRPNDYIIDLNSYKYYLVIGRPMTLQTKIQKS